MMDNELNEKLCSTSKLLFGMLASPSINRVELVADEYVATAYWFDNRTPKIEFEFKKAVQP